MRDESGVVEILWVALRALDTSKDARKESAPLAGLRQEMLRTVLELELSSEQPEQHNARGATEPVPINAGLLRKKGTMRPGTGG